MSTLPARQVNKEPILAEKFWLNTWEVECKQCRELRWPTLAEKPRSYVCARCRAQDPSKVVLRRQAAQKARVTRVQRGH